MYCLVRSSALLISAFVICSTNHSFNLLTSKPFAPAKLVQVYPSTLLPVLLKALKLASFAKHWEPLAQKTIDEQWLPQTYLAALCEQEAGSRYQKKLQRYLREAQLPSAKQLSQFDFKASSDVNKPQITALSEQRQWVK